MEQDWNIKEVKIGQTWENSYGVFQSYSLVLEGHAEPVSMNKKFPVASPPVAGTSIYGVIEQVQNKNGTINNKFVTKQRPEATAAPQTGSKPQSGSWHESPEKQASINRSVALNNAAVLFEGLGGGVPIENVITIADTFYTWLSKSDKGNVEEVMGETENVNLDDIVY